MPAVHQLDNATTKNKIKAAAHLALTETPTLPTAVPPCTTKTCAQKYEQVKNASWKLFRACAHELPLEVQRYLKELTDPEISALVEVRTPCAAPLSVT